MHDSDFFQCVENLDKEMTERLTQGKKEQDRLSHLLTLPRDPSSKPGGGKNLQIYKLYV